MSAILVSGLINIETTLRVDGFPIGYTPVRYPFWGVHSTVAGVGYNITRALVTLGDEVRFVSLIGEDTGGWLVRHALEEDGLPQGYVLAEGQETARSVILYDGTGRRQINVDLKDVQERAYPSEAFTRALAGGDLAVLCNINFSRPYLKVARKEGVLVATDVHTVASLDDDYNRDFMAAADVLFMSDEALPTTPEAFARGVMERYAPRVLVIGLGAKGALLADREGDWMGRLPAVRTREIVNTIGAGDALFSAFVHFYARSHSSYTALRKAIVFASHKIGEKGAAEGFLTEEGVEEWLDHAGRHYEGQ
jgi:ribokinase